MNISEINHNAKETITKLEQLIESAINALKNGQPVIVTDDDDRENEGDYIFLADRMTQENMNFLVTEARGLVCVAVSETIAKRLNFGLMVSHNEDPHGTAFTVSVDHCLTTTGISAVERALTVNKIACSESRPEDFRRPGHIFPLVAKSGGVLERRGHTEAAVDLAQMCGAETAGVICEILKADGEMARRDDLRVLAEKHGVLMLSIEQIVQYRLLKEQQVIKRAASVRLPSYLNKTNSHTNEQKPYAFQMIGYEDNLNHLEHVALVAGSLNPDSPPLVRIHSECLTGDVFGSLRCDCGSQLNLAKTLIAEQGGIILYMRQEGRGIGLLNKLKAYELQEQGLDTVEANHQLGFGADLRRYEVCALMLKDLGINRIRLLTNNPEKVIALAQYGIEVVEREPIVTGLDAENERYIQTKITKMAHEIK